MKRLYLDEMKRLAELEKHLAPARMVTVEMPDGTEKKLSPLEFWPQRSRFVETDERGVTRFKAWVEGFSPQLFTILLMEAEFGDLEDETQKRAVFNILTLFFGRSVANQIMTGYKSKNAEAL